MLYLVSYKTKEIIRDDNGNPVLSKTNHSPEISEAVKKYGPVWCDLVPWQNTSNLTYHAKLTKQDLDWINSITEIKQTPKPISDTGNGLFDFM